MTDLRPNITDEQLAVDIANTEREQHANALLASGFRILADLPETDPNDRRLFAFHSSKHEGRVSQCGELLARLKALEITRMAARAEEGAQGEVHT